MFVYICEIDFLLLNEYLNFSILITHAVNTSRHNPYTQRSLKSSILLRISRFETKSLRTAHLGFKQSLL